MNLQRIETEATYLRKELWKHHQSLLGHTPLDPVDLIDPRLGAKILGIDYEVLQDLGCFGNRTGKFDVAGMIDRPRNKISVAMKYGLRVQRFTGAHELGHWHLHPNETMHRDRPIEGMVSKRAPREPAEREADHFSACFLIPEHGLRKRFASLFGKLPFMFDDAAAFYLSPRDPEALFYPPPGSLDRALALANAHSYGGHRFLSLVQQFNVSPTSMAIRIEELGLIRH